MPAILFGSISSIVDTSELQRNAFNEAFKAHGLQWHWDREQYRGLLASNGGQNRIAEYAASLGQKVDARAIHETKSTIFQDSLALAATTPRPGVVETIRAARDHGFGVALVTTTSPANVTALLEGVSPDLAADDFDIVVDSSAIELPKPDPAAYEFALATLEEQARDCVAIEDNVGGIQSAIAAGVRCVAYPNENTAGHDFGPVPVVDRIDFDDLLRLMATSAT